VQRSRQRSRINTVKVSATRNERKMDSEKRVGKKDIEKEEYWRAVLKQCSQSQQSQSAFCKEQGLNKNTFWYWKSVISQRDAEKARINKGYKRRRAAATKTAQAESPPLFARFAIADLSPTETGPPPRKSSQSEIPPSVAAEIVDANNGRRLRVFNGADQATVTALISALASLSGCSNGF